MRAEDAQRRSVFDCYFCPECGNRIYHVSPGMPQFIRLKPGTLEDTSMIQPDVDFWVKRKRAWVVIPEGVSQFETEPGTFRELAAAVAAARGKRAQT